MANLTKLTAKKRGEFIELLAECGNVSKVCKKLSLSRTIVYEYRDTDANFSAQWDQALEEYTEKLEEEADRRAIEGTEKPVFYKGYEVGHIREYSDTLLMFRLKALAPDKYRERQDIQHGGSITVKGYVNVSPDDWDESADASGS